METNKQTKVAVVCGGISSEREISLRSGKNCFEALQRLGYKNSFLHDVRTIEDLLELKHKKTEIAFLTTHGKWGEDGAIQGILEWLRIPYTGSSITGSAIAMDKWLTKQIAKNLDILIPKAFLVTEKNKNSINISSLWKEYSKKNSSVFLKPKDGGSSVNTFKIKSIDDLESSLQKLNLVESDYLIEECISGREITVSILEINKEFKILPVLELKPKNEFYDFEAKYTKGMTEFILPSKIETNCLKKLEHDSVNIFTAIEGSSFGRIDYMLDSNNNAYLLEINSLPGMTDTSDLPAQAAIIGINYDNLVELILKTAKLH